MPREHPLRRAGPRPVEAGQAAVFANPHACSEFEAIAAAGTVLRGQVGSGLHGVTTGDDDRDEMGVCIEPPAYVIGNSRFEQYLYRTRPEGVGSGAGDLDLVVYADAGTGPHPAVRAAPRRTHAAQALDRADDLLDSGTA